MRDFSQDHRWLSINTATVRKQQGAEVPLADDAGAMGASAFLPCASALAAGMSSSASSKANNESELSKAELSLTQRS